MIFNIGYNGFMHEIFSRNELYWGKEFQEHLSGLKIAVFGLGGVGGFALEALCRAGIGHFLIVAFDTISKTNINRQLIALNSTVGRKKTEVFKTRLLDINPNVKVQVYDGFFTEDTQDKVFSGEFSVYTSGDTDIDRAGEASSPDFIVDAIDTVKSKIELIKFAKENEVEIISSFGAGNRMDATKLFVSDISELKALGGTKDSFVKNVLNKLKKYVGIEEGLTVVSSSEKAHNKEKISALETVDTGDGKSVQYTKFTPASTPVVPAVAGYLMANHILKTCYNNFSNLKS